MANKPNILLLIVDGFRADRCFGKKKTSITPNLDKILKEGTYFSENVTAAPVTIPSMSSIISSLYPFRSVTEDNTLFNLNPNVENYVEKLREIGYNAYATVPESLMISRIPSLFVEGSESFPYTMTSYNGLGKQIVKKIESGKLKEPWIYYVHLYDLYVGTSFEIPEGESQEILTEKKFGVNKYERVLSAMDEWIGKIIGSINKENTFLILSGDHGTDIGDYDDELESWFKKNYEMRTSWEPSMKLKIGQKLAKKSPSFLQPLRKKISKKITDKRFDSASNGVWIPEREKIEKMKIPPYKKRVMKNAIFTMSQVYDDRFRVPLFFMGPKIPQNKIITKQSRSVDIFPTITDIANISINLKDIHGKSLFPLMMDDTIPEEPAYLESSINSPKMLSENTIAVRTSEFKYFRNRHDAEKDVHLFDLKKDPLEENNIQGNNPEIVKKMEEILLALQSGKGFSYDKGEDLTDDEVKKAEDILSKLGYI